MSGWDTAVGAVEGAGTGAMIGAECGGVYGAIAGAVIGAVAGGVMGYETGEKKDEGVRKAQESADESTRLQKIGGYKQGQAAIVASMNDPSHSAQGIMTKSTLQREQDGGYTQARIDNMHFKAVDNKTSSRVAVAPTYGTPAAKLA